MYPHLVRRGFHGVDTSSSSKPTCPGPTIITGQAAVLTLSRAAGDKSGDLPFAVRPRPTMSTSAPEAFAARPSTPRGWVQDEMAHEDIRKLLRVQRNGPA